MEDSFKLLEDGIQRAASRLKELQSEIESLRGELAEARARAGAAEQKLEEAVEAERTRAATVKKTDGHTREVKVLRKEREEIRARIERLVELLDGLD